MIRRTRMFAAAAAVALTGGLVGVVTPAQAATPTVGFSCTENLLPTLLSPLGVSLPLGTVNLPIDLSVLDNLTVPIGSTIAPVTGTLGIAPLLATVGTTIDSIVNVTSTLTAQVGNTTVPLVFNALTGALQVPSLPVPSLPGPLPVSLAQPSSLTFGLKGVLGALVGTVSCVLPAASGQLANILVRTPTQISSGTTVGAGPVSFGGGWFGTGTGTGTTSAGTAPSNPCTQPLARAARTAKVSARTAKRSVSSTVAPRIVVHTSKRAAGAVVACYGTTPIAKASVRHGRAMLLLPRFYPGRYRIAVRYLGAGHFRGTALKVPMRITL